MNLPTALAPKSERAFLAFTAVLFTAMVLFNYGPVFVGKIPLPGHLMTQFPVWSEFKSREPWQAVADIGDLIDYFYPFNAFSANQIRHGTLPLWNPFLMSGMPFQAEPQTALFYPLHALYYVFSTPTAWSLSLMLRMFLAAMFMTLLMRSLTATKAGSVASGITFAFGGFMVAWQGAVMGDAVMWLPLVCYSVHRLHICRSRLSVCLTAFAFAMPVLAGHPESAIHVILTGTAGALLLWAFPRRLERRFDLRFLSAFSLAGIIALGLGAVQLLPTLEWVGQSGRDLNALWGSFELHQALGFFSRDALRGPNSAGIFVPNAMGYVGMLTLLAAALAPLHRSTRYVVWFLSLVIIGIAGTFGFEPVRSILTHVPIIKGLKNERLILLVDFGLAALAGLGISALQEDRTNNSAPRLVLPWLLLAAAFSVAMVFIHKLQLATQFKVEVMRRPSFSRTLLLCALIVLIWKLIRGQRARLFPLIACALLVFDLSSFAYGYTGFTWRDEVFPATPVFDFLKKEGNAGTFRIAPIGLTYPSNSALAYGLQAVSGFEAAVPEALQRFILGLNEVYPDRINLLSENVSSARDRRFDMLNAKYVIVPTAGHDYEMFSQRQDRFSQILKLDKVAVFQNKTVLPRAFIMGVDGVRVIKGDAEQIEAVKDQSFDPRRTVVIESLPQELAEVRPEAEFSGNVEIVDSDVNGYHFRVEASIPGVLVVSQNFYPGWKAFINGRSASVFPADHALTGIAVPAGRYDVYFEFQPSSFKLGALLSIISVILFGGLLASAWREGPW